MLFAKSNSYTVRKDADDYTVFAHPCQENGDFLCKVLRSAFFFFGEWFFYGIIGEYAQTQKG